MAGRRDFIKKATLATGGLLFLPSFMQDDVYAENVIKKARLPVEPGKWSSENISMAWIGHSTILINFFGKWILTDPVLFLRIGVNILGTTFGPSRLTYPALKPDEIPKPDLILLSHGHMDHTDYPTLKYFAEKHPRDIDVVCAYLTKDIIAGLPWKSVTEIDWQQEIKTNGFRISAIEPKHFGWRYPWEKDRSRGYMKDGRSYNSLLIEYMGATIFFAGDTALTDNYKIIGGRKVDIAMMPIGAYNPWRKVHCSPEEAMEMADHVNAERFVPMHCMTFQQGEEAFEDPVNRLHKYKNNYNTKVMWDEIGSSLVL